METKNSTEQIQSALISLLIISTVSKQMNEFVFSGWNIQPFRRFIFTELHGHFWKNPLVRILPVCASRRGAEQLRFTGLPVQEIAYNVGYEVPSSFSKAFKLWFNVSPIEFRNTKEIKVMEREKTNHVLDIKVQNAPVGRQNSYLHVGLTGDFSEFELRQKRGRSFGDR